MPATAPSGMRDGFIQAMHESLDQDPELCLVLADISAAEFEAAAAAHPHRVVNVGIREQLMIGVAGGMALAGLRPVVHTYAPFLVERPFEQLKLDLGHQDVGAVLVSIGGSVDAAQAGRTHQSPGDVALLDTLPGWRVHVPGHPQEAEELLASSLPGTGRIYLRLGEQANTVARPTGQGMVRVRSGDAAVVVAVGPMLDPVLEACQLAGAAGEVTVLYANTVRPLDTASVRAELARTGAQSVLLVEPYMAGTSSHLLDRELGDLPHRRQALGISRDAELRRYGTPAQHLRAHGLDAAGIAARLRRFRQAASSVRQGLVGPLG